MKENKIKKKTKKKEKGVYFPQLTFRAKVIYIVLITYLALLLIAF